MVRITSLPASAHAQWCEVVTADMDGNRIQSLHNRRLPRFNAEQPWVNLKRQGWKQVPPPLGDNTAPGKNRLKQGGRASPS